MYILSRTEEMLLISVWKLQDEAYGLSIRTHFSELVGKEMSVGATYIPLERLKKQGFLESWESEPTEKRGGRSKRFYRLTAEGINALSRVKSIHDRAWTGLPNLIFNKSE